MAVSLAWVTDIHLNFLKTEAVNAFCDRIGGANPNAVLITGDIGEASDVEEFLARLEERLVRPIYFVLGNHDFYGGSIPEVRSRVSALSRRSRWLKYLPVEGVVELTSQAGMVGHDGWADGRAGDYSGSQVRLNDYILIRELAGLSEDARLRQLQQLGDEAAAYFREVLPMALDRYDLVIVATHVPPFEESCWYQGKISDDQWLPHFTAAAVGEALREVMAAYPGREMIVLCGHTHSGGIAQILPNLQVRTGSAVYGSPDLQEVLEVD